MSAYALSWSGGKDSTLALDRALREGAPVRYLFNIYDGSSGRVRFHGVRTELITAQAEALGLELVQRPSREDDFEAVFRSILDELADRDVHGVVFGNIHLADVRAWYEERTAAMGFEHIEPLWGDAPAELLGEFAALGYRAVVVSVDTERADGAWLGRELDEELIAEILRREDVDPCGEQGEFHTFAFAGPLFRHTIAVQTGEIRKAEGHRLIDLTVT